LSGTETLVPYLKERKESARDQPTIVVDYREANTASKIVKGLTERGATIRTETLEKGDYIISDQCAVERKTVHDFVYTLTRRFLFEQLFKLKEVYPKSIILLEGYLPVIYKYSRIQPAAVWGALFNLARNGVAIINTTSYKETVDFLYVAAKQEQVIEKRSATVHPFKRCDTIADGQLYLVASLPNVGREKALAILKAYQTPLNALINVDNWSETVHGLGPKISSKVKDVLNTPFVDQVDSEPNSS
jgi:Fanconi anemia group M protein